MRGSSQRCFQDVESGSEAAAAAAGALRGARWRGAEHDCGFGQCGPEGPGTPRCGWAGKWRDWGLGEERGCDAVAKGESVHGVRE